jgi:alkylation response protein AidB-like acyl-CoA dehydrogenase
MTEPVAGSDRRSSRPGRIKTATSGSSTGTSGSSAARTALAAILAARRQEPDIPQATNTAFIVDPRPTVGPKCGRDHARSGGHSEIVIEDRVHTTQCSVGAGRAIARAVPAQAGTAGTACAGSRGQIAT